MHTPSSLSDSPKERLARAQAALAEALQEDHREATSQPGEAGAVHTAYAKAREMAFRHLGLDRSKSSGHLRQFLTEHDVDPDLAGQIVCDLMEDGYIDDRRAAARVVRRYQGGKVRSRRQMFQLFLRQGVAVETAEAVLAELPEDERSIQNLLPPDWPDDAREDAKLRRFLASRGYSWELISRVYRDRKREE